MSIINVGAVLRAISAAEERALEEVAAQIAADARARAPIRKVFREAKGFRRRFRPLTPLERNLAIRRAQAYSGYNDYHRRRVIEYLRGRITGVGTDKSGRGLGHGRYFVRAEVRRRGSANNLANSRSLRNFGTVHRGVFTPGPALRSGSLSARLTLRGRYEVASGRAIHEEVLSSGAVRLQIGGRLKASIGSEGVVVTGQGATAKVTAGVRYAKFVEFPTTHNAAQPFLLPALHDNRTKLRQTLAREVRQALGGQ